MLIGVQGVGPKVALAVLSGGAPRELLNAIAAGDTARFQAVPGIGKRTAERIIVELREKVAGQGHRRDRGPPHRVRRPAHARARGPARPRLHARRRPTAARRGRRRHARGADRRRAEGGADERRSARPASSASRTRPPLAAEDELDRSLRPKPLDDFVGQERVKEQLAIFIEAARARGEALDHVLLAGPARARQDVARADRRQRAGRPVRAHRRPGARAQGRRRQLPDRARAAQRLLRRRDPPAPARARGDLLSRDGGPQAADHRRAGRRARASSRSTCPTFTLIGATTRTGLLTTPLRDRFGVTHRLELYEPADLARIVLPLGRHPRRGDRRRRAPRRSPRRSRGTPRVANRLLKRVRDFAEVRGAGRIDAARRRARRSTCSRSTTPGSTGSTARSCAPSARSSAAARSGFARSRSRWARSRTRSRTCTSRTCSSRASSCAPRAAASPPTPPSPTSASKPPRGGAQRLF